MSALTRHMMDTKDGFAEAVSVAAKNGWGDASLTRFRPGRGAPVEITGKTLAALIDAVATRGVHFAALRAAYANAYRTARAIADEAQS